MFHCFLFTYLDLKNRPTFWQIAIDALTIQSLEILLIELEVQIKDQDFGPNHFPQIQLIKQIKHINWVLKLS